MNGLAGSIRRSSGRTFYALAFPRFNLSHFFLPVLLQQQAHFKTAGRVRHICLFCGAHSNLTPVNPTLKKLNTGLKIR